jgi:DNA-directed RNA polymerase subunit RPC12/RpoP/gas vesicle protein
MNKNIDMSILTCPRCGANLEVENDLDVCYCKYCGCRIMVHGRSDEAYKAEAKIKSMAHEETMLDKQIAFEKYKMDVEKEKEKEDMRIVKRLFIGMVVAFAMLFIWLDISTKLNVAKNTKKLNSYVKQAEEEMNAGDYEAAYNTAEYIKWYNSSSEKYKKWNKIRENLIDDIMEAEKADTGTVTYEPEPETETEEEKSKKFEKIGKVIDFIANMKKS